MASPLSTLFFCAALLHVGTNAHIYSKEVNTAGFVKGGMEKETHFGIGIIMDTYNKDTTCIKVVRVLQIQLRRKVDEFVVNCENSWSETKERIHYGEDVYIQTEEKKAVWALFFEEKICTRRKYTDNGVQQLAKEDDVLTKDECMKLLHGEESHAKIYSMEIDVKGFAKGRQDKSVLSGLTMFMSTFNKDTTCIKVMRVFQNSPKRKVDDFTVTCDAESWSEEEGMVSYGEIVHVKTEEKKAEWALFVKQDECLQRTYTDNEVLQLVKEDRVLTKEECEQVLLDKQPIEDLDEEEEVADEEDNNDEPGVISMDNIDTKGYAPVYTVDTLRCRPLGMRVDSQDYYSDDDSCVRLAWITAYGMKVEHMKITCDLDNGRELFGHYQFGYAFTFRPGRKRNSYVGLYNLRDGTCIKRTYSATRRRPRRVVVTKEDKTDDDECKALAEGKNMINENEILASVNLPIRQPQVFPIQPEQGWVLRDFNVVVEY